MTHPLKYDLQLGSATAFTATPSASRSTQRPPGGAGSNGVPVLESPLVSLDCTPELEDAELSVPVVTAESPLVDPELLAGSAPLLLVSAVPVDDVVVVETDTVVSTAVDALASVVPSAGVASDWQAPTTSIVIQRAGLRFRVLLTLPTMARTRSIRVPRSMARACQHRHMHPPRCGIGRRVACCPEDRCSAECRSGPPQRSGPETLDAVFFFLFVRFAMQGSRRKTPAIAGATSSTTVSRGARRRATSSAEPPEPPAGPRRPHVAVINADLRIARDLCNRLTPRSIEAHAFDDLEPLRRHISKHADTLDVIIFDAIVPGGEPSDLFAALLSAESPSALLLITRLGERIARPIARRVRAEAYFLGDPGTDDLVRAIRRIGEVVDERRIPMRCATPTQPTDDAYEAVLDLIMWILERAGLRKSGPREAIRMRVCGMTDDGSARERRMAEASVRRQVHEAHKALGTDDAYHLIRLLAVRASAAIMRIATQRDCPVESVFAELRDALVGAPSPA